MSQPYPKHLIRQSGAFALTVPLEQLSILEMGVAQIRKQHSGNDWLEYGLEFKAEGFRVADIGEHMSGRDEIRPGRSEGAAAVRVLQVVILLEKDSKVGANALFKPVGIYGIPLEDAIYTHVARDPFWGMNVALQCGGRPHETGDPTSFLLGVRAGLMTGAAISIDVGTDF